MHKILCSRHLRWALAAITSVACISQPVQQFIQSPAALDVPLGEHRLLHVALPTGSQAFTSDNRIADVKVVPSTSHSRDVAVVPTGLGDAIISTRLYGVLPWKAVHVHVVPREYVYVGGQSVGIRLHSRGVTVVGFQRVGSSRYSPAARANVHVGDVIEQVNRHPVRTADDVHRWTQTREQVLELVLRRAGERRVVRVAPVTDEVGRKRLGLYVREKTSGVGTLTFYDPTKHRFGALGHIITDVDTGQPIDGYGQLFAAEVTGVVRGQAGKPGEKRGRFVAEDHPLGAVEKNTPYGVFGTMPNTPGHAYETRPLPLALPAEVHTGPAKLLTVIQGEDVRVFDVEIENLVRQPSSGTKSMVVHVTDRCLLAATGGIVQGMSGSPLIQDGKLIGAVTHVFVSDPTRGYAVYAQWMYNELERRLQQQPDVSQTDHGER